MQLEHALIVEDEHYEYPPVEILSTNTKRAARGGAKLLADTAAKLQKHYIVLGYLQK